MKIYTESYYYRCAELLTELKSNSVEVIYYLPGDVLLALKSTYLIETTSNFLVDHEVTPYFASPVEQIFTSLANIH